MPSPITRGQSYEIRENMMREMDSATNEMERRIERTISSVKTWRNRAIKYSPIAPSVVSPIHRGVESACYKVSIDNNENYFLKVLFDDMEEFTSFSQTAAICHQLGELGVTPSLLSANEETRTMLFNYLDDAWSWGKVDDLSNSVVLENTINAKVKIQEGALFDREQSVFERIRSYWKKISEVNAFAPEDVSAIVDQTTNIEKAIQAGGVDIKPCHGDGTASNIMIGPQGAVQLVDFDWSTNADPHYDMATLMLEGFQAPSDMWEVVEIFDGSVNERIYNRCRLYGIADDLMWALWGFLCFKISPRVEVEFTKYAEWRLLRCRMNLGDPGFDKWLRRV